MLILDQILQDVENICRDNAGLDLNYGKIKDYSGEAGKNEEYNCLDIDQENAGKSLVF